MMVIWITFTCSLAGLVFVASCYSLYLQNGISIITHGKTLGHLTVTQHVQLQLPKFKVLIKIDHPRLYEKSLLFVTFIAMQYSINGKVYEMLHI